MQPKQFSEEQLATLERVGKSFQKGAVSFAADQAKSWLKQKGLSAERTGAGFNSGQLHHRKPLEFLEKLLSIGILYPNTKGSGKGYHIFGDYCMIFPLRNEEDQVVNFFSIGIEHDKKSFLNKEGLFPAFPRAETKLLYVTKSILDAATIMESEIPNATTSVIALYEGELLLQHVRAIQTLREIEQVIVVE